ARPAARTQDRSSARMLLVLDSSWSMRARLPSGGTRWDRAIEQARAMAAGSTAEEVSVATTGEGIVEAPTSDHARLDRTLARLTPSGSPDGSWPRLVDAGSTHLFTDGALPRATTTDVTVHSVFVPAANVAVTAFDVDRAPSGTGAQIVLSVANFAVAAQSVHLTITRGADTLFDQSIPIAASGSYRDVLAIPAAGDARFHAHVSAAGNALDVDDDAGAWLWMAQPLRVGVVEAASPAAALLAHDPTLRVTVVDPARYPESNADVWVFDRWLPAAPPAQPALVIDPPASAWLGRRGPAEAQPTWHPVTAHPVLDGVDAALGRLGSAHPIDRPALQAIAASERNTPLVSIEEGPQSRYVVVGFSVQDASFVSTPAYPILVGNAVDWLGRPERGARHQPGRVTLPASTRRIVSPSGRALPLKTLDAHISATLPDPGLYLADTAGGQRVLSVGLDDPARSNLRSSTLPEDPSVPQRWGRAQRPWWTYCAAAAFVLAALEWITWRRRITV
ncbi:MAG: VWA domain-containing protein, partial [Vicinamibacterales bacterium]